MAQTSNNPNQAAKFAFFYMLSLVALVFMALSTGMIIFQIINKYIHDVLEPFGGRFSDPQLKFAISALVISAPIFYITAWQIQKNLFTGALDKDSGIRRWLTYLVLFAASVVMIGWLIGTLNTFLDGELTLKFGLKAISALAIAGTIFSFYLYDIRREKIKGQKDRVIKIYFYAALSVVAAAFITSLFLVESPAEARDRRFDDMVINDFSSLESAIQSYYTEFGALPDNLETIKGEYDYISADELNGPYGEQEYVYRITGERSFELCAEFRASSRDEAEEKYRYAGGSWLHGAGEQCLERNVRIENPTKPRPLPVE